MAYDNEPIDECKLAGDKHCTDVARRGAIKKLVFGATAITAFAAFPAKWNKPLIEQIVLPAHAQTSGANPVSPQDPDPDPDPPEPWLTVICTNNMEDTSVTVTITPESSPKVIYEILPGSQNAYCGVYFPSPSIEIVSSTLMDIYINSSLAFSSTYGFSDVMNSGSLDFIFEAAA